MVAPLSGENPTCIRGNRRVSRASISPFMRGRSIAYGTKRERQNKFVAADGQLGVPAEGHSPCGVDCRDNPAAHRADIHYVGHYDAAKPALTVRENLAFWAALHGGGDIEAGLESFDLSALAELPVRFLSAGQKRRLALARLVALDASVWLLDEPSVALDAASLDALRELIAEHKGHGGAVVASTHADLGLADALTLDVSQFSPNRQPEI